MEHLVQDYEYSVWEEGDSTRPQSFPFVYGPDGTGEIHPADQPNDQQPRPSIPGTLAERPTPTGDLYQGSSPSESQSPNTMASQTVVPGVVSYAIPTPATPLSQLSALNSTSTSILSSSSSTPVTTATPVLTHTTTPIQTSSSTASSLTSSTLTLTSTSTPSTDSLPLSTSDLPSTSIVYTTPTITAPATSIAHQFRHTPAFIILIILCLLVFLGTLFASLSWIISRKRKKEDDNWIGTLVHDEPTDYGGGKEDWVEHKNVGRSGTGELEKAGTGDETGRYGMEDMGSGNDYGQAGVGTGGPRVWSSHNVTTPIEPSRIYAPTHSQYTNTPMSTHAVPGPASYTPASLHGFTPNLNPNPTINVRHASILHRGAPAASDYDMTYGLDGGGLTFRRDLAQRTHLAPVTEHSDIITPNPYSRPTSPHRGSSNPRHPDPAVMRDSASHYSYALDGAGPFAVTNLVPGDISSCASSTSLGLATADRAGKGRSREGGKAKSLGLPTGKLDDPNPWKRYEGVEGRGGGGSGANVVLGQMGAAGSTGAGEGGWVGTIRSGLYSAVGRIVGQGSAGHSDLEGTGVQRDTSQDINNDRFTQAPSSIRRRNYDASVSKSSTKSSIHPPSPIAGRQARILQRLDSTGTTDAGSLVSSPMTVYSSDEGMVFSTRATSRRDTVSTWTTTRSRSLKGGGKKKDSEGGAEEEGGSEMNTRASSNASSEWGSGGLVRVLGMEKGPSRKGREE